MKISKFAASLYVFAALSALVSVALAALTAHGLQRIAPTGAQALEWFKTATDFQMSHALGVILVAAIADQIEAGRARGLMRAAALLLAVAALLFPAGLYSLSFDGPAFFAPWGGTASLAGWAVFAVAVVLAAVNTPEESA